MSSLRQFIQTRPKQLLQGHAMSGSRTYVPAIVGVYSAGGENIQRTAMISLAEGPGRGFRPVFLIKTVYLISAGISRGRSPRGNPPVPVGHGITHRPFTLRAEGDWLRNAIRISRSIQSVPPENPLPSIDGTPDTALWCAILLHTTLGSILPGSTVVGSLCRSGEEPESVF